MIISRQKPREPVCARPDHRFTTGGAPTSPPECLGKVYTSAGRDSHVRDPYRIRGALRNANRVRYPQRRGHMKRVNVKLLLPSRHRRGKQDAEVRVHAQLEVRCGTLRRCLFGGLLVTSLARQSRCRQTGRRASATAAAKTAKEAHSSPFVVVASAIPRAYVTSGGPCLTWEFRVH